MTVTIPQPAAKKPRKKRPVQVTEEKVEQRKCSGGTAACLNCCRKAKLESEKDEKKKPMYKLGSWRGAFKGTKDF